MAPSSINVAKANIARATGLMAAGTCATSVIRWAFRKGRFATDSADPRVRIPTEQIKAWTGIWARATADTKMRIEKVWTETHVKLKRAKQRWQCVKGPIAASIATLIDAEWRPVKPTEWITPNSGSLSHSSKDTAGMAASFANFRGHEANQVLHRLEEDLEAKLWKEASTARNGQGLEKGKPNFGPASKAHANFVRKGDHRKAKAIELISCNKV